ncbi:MAG: hypothetical protein AAFZ09_17275 [Pseudomonadota bacterium]
MGGLLYIVVTVLSMVAMWRILPRAGISPLWAIACIVPAGQLILLMVLAFRPWPGDPGYRGNA